MANNIIQNFPERQNITQHALEKIQRKVLGFRLLEDDY